MGCAILDVSGEKEVVSTAGYFARKPITGIFSSWTTLRVALFLKINDTGATIVAPRLAFGLCSGTSAIPGDASVTHFCGMKTNGSNWSRLTAAVRYNYSNFALPTKTVATTDTVGTSFSNTSVLHTTALSMLFVDITKGSPNYSLKLFHFTNASGTAPVCTLSDFNTQSVSTTPAFTGHAFTAAQTVAVDETADGAFDAACFWWNQVSPTIQIASWRVFKVA